MAKEEASAVHGDVLHSLHLFVKARADLVETKGRVDDLEVEIASVLKSSQTYVVSGKTALRSSMERC